VIAQNVPLIGTGPRFQKLYFRDHSLQCRYCYVSGGRHDALNKARLNPFQTVR
jgi:hypothetical protein